MKKSIYLQIFVLAIIVALMGSFNNYGQNKPKKDIQFKGKTEISKNIQTNKQNRNSKDIQLNFKGGSKVLTSYQPNSIQNVLYDQTAGTIAGYGPASQDFETGFDIYDCQAADDFTVTGGPWTVRRVIIGGGYYNGAGPAAGFNVYIYANAAGVPGALVYSATAQPYYNYGTGFFGIGLGTAAVLANGTYWLSVQCRMDLATGGQFAWDMVSGTHSLPAQWQNPGGGFGACLTWDDLNTCNGITPETDLSFALTDEECPAVPLPVVEDFESGLFPPLCWTVVNSPTDPIWASSEDLVALGYPAVSGYGDGLYSTWADFYDFDGVSGDLITLEFDASTASYPTLSFDWAYADFSGSEPDELDIYYSTNGGTNWTILAAMYNGALGENNLNPYGLTTTAPYYPCR